MTEQAYIVAARRTPVGRARGVFSKTRPDDLLTHVIKGVVDDCNGLEGEEIADVVAGCAMPEGEQGLNVARMSALMAGLPDSVPGFTVNRFCASGVQAIATAASRIQLGEADIIIGCGVESMSMVPMGGNSPSYNQAIFEDNDVALAYGMGITAENVAQKYDVSREEMDAFSLQSHQRAIAAIEAGVFKDEILPYEVVQRVPGSDGTVQLVRKMVTDDEGPRADTTMEVLGKLRTVFAADGRVTAGNSSQMSDGAGAAVLMSERKMKELNLEPLARFVGFDVAGVPPAYMGIGPKEAVPKVLKQVGLKLEDIDLIELNEAFAAQSLAVINELGLDQEIVNPTGGAISQGHPLGATGAIRAATLIHALRRTNKRYGIVTMCIGSGMGAAGVFERC